MRELKFRFWDRQTKLMVTGSPELLIDSGDGEVFETVSGLDGYSMNQSRFNLIPMQFTGLQDKNSKEVYEGDILRCHHFEDVDGEHFLYHIVTWSQKFHGWLALNCHSMNYDDGSPQMFVYCKNDFEIVGNIHENPELLEQSND